MKSRMCATFVRCVSAWNIFASTHTGKGQETEERSCVERATKDPTPLLRQGFEHAVAEGLPLDRNRLELQVRVGGF